MHIRWHRRRGLLEAELAQTERLPGGRPQVRTLTYLGAVKLPCRGPQPERVERRVRFWLRCLGALLLWHIDQSLDRGDADGRAVVPALRPHVRALTARVPFLTDGEVLAYAQTHCLVCEPGEPYTGQTRQAVLLEQSESMGLAAFVELHQVERAV